VGRIDCIYSPHDAIGCRLLVQAFALNTDEKFVGRIKEVESLLDGNLKLLPEMLREEAAGCEGWGFLILNAGSFCLPLELH